MNKQWLALILCAGLTLGQYPVSGAQKESAEQTETAGQSAENNEETSVPAETQTYQDAEENTEEWETEEPEETEDPSSGETEESNISEEMLSWIREAAASENLAPDSETAVNFYKASDWYDNLTDEEKETISQEDVQALETTRNRISEVISTAEGVTVAGNPWYVQIHVEKADGQETTVQELAAAYPGTAPVLIYDVKLYYTDIRTGEIYLPMQTISLNFPVPEEYDSLTCGRILRPAGDSFMELTPDRMEDNTFYLDSARTLKHLIIADFPAGLQGIKLNHKSLKINKGQKSTLKVVPVPEAVTEEYTITWKSSDTAVAKVNKSGTVTAVKTGKAVITATVTEHPEFSASCNITVMQGANALKKSVSQVMAETSAYMRATDTNPSVGSEWFVLGLARGGLSLNEKYFSTYYNHTANYIEENKGILTNTSKYTEYSKRILVLTAEGKDARNVGGYNLFKYISDLSLVKEQGLNGPIWALLAVNCHPEYSFPKNSSAKEQNSEAALVSFLLQSELSGGGWALIGSNPDSDITGMALQALAPYYHKDGYENVTAAIDRALAVLSNMQNNDGGYSTMGVETEESCAQVITALCSLGIDPETDARFIKGGHWTIENLISYHIDGSGFMHVKAGAGNNGGAAAGTLDGMATEQGYYALVAYQRMKDGKTSLYDMSDVSIKKGGKGDGNGTGLKEPTPIPRPTPTTSPSTGNSKTPGGSGKSLGGKSSGSDGSKTAGGSGKSLASGKSSKSSSKNSSKNSKSNKDKSSGGWDFEASPYEETSEETTQITDADMGSAGETGTLSAGRHIDYTLILASAFGALVGGVAGPAIRDGIKALIHKRRKKQ